MEPMQNLGSYTVSRKISMYYKIDLKKDNRWSPYVAAALRRHDGRMRACYTERLNSQPLLRGEVSVAFRLERGSKAAKETTRVGGSIKDISLTDCLRQRLTEISFDPPKDMNGLITWEFKVLTGVAQN